jgi:hypothetical protein
MVLLEWVFGSRLVLLQWPTDEHNGRSLARCLTHDRQHRPAHFLHVSLQFLRGEGERRFRLRSPDDNLCPRLTARCNGEAAGWRIRSRRRRVEYWDGKNNCNVPPRQYPRTFPDDDSDHLILFMLLSLQRIDN